MSDVLQPQPMHAFNHAPAALRIFRFAADSAPRVLELAHVSAFLRECAVEFGSADATLPGALRCEYAAKRFGRLRAVVESNAARCPWLAEKLLACRSGAPVPAAALAPDVTRHDVNWGAEGARRHELLVVSGDGSALTLKADVYAMAWAQGAVGVSCGKHFFQVCVLQSKHDEVRIGFIDRALHGLREGVGAWKLTLSREWCDVRTPRSVSVRHGAALGRNAQVRSEGGMPVHDWLSSRRRRGYDDGVRRRRAAGGAVRVQVPDGP
jgi:hypothetical protein